TATVADFAEISDVAQPEVARHFDLAAALHRVHGETIDFAGSQSRVIEGGLDRPAGERQLRFSRAFGELGLSDADDRGAVLDLHGRGTMTEVGKSWNSDRSPKEAKLAGDL